MLDAFLKVAYAHTARAEEERDAIALLEQLPERELAFLAGGGKTASLGCAPESSAASRSFLDQFRGTPLLAQAVALEQEELQADMADLERRKERRVEHQMEVGLWDMRDQIRVKKRLLEMQLAQEDAGMGPQAGGDAPAGPLAPPPPQGSAQGAGTSGPTA